MLMDWLLKYEGYPPGVVVAVMMHAVLLYFLLPKEVLPEEFLRVPPPSISVTMATENPQRQRLVEQQRQSAQDAQRQRELEAERLRQVEADRQRQAEAERQAELKRQADLQRQADAQRQQQEQERLAREAERVERERREQLARDAEREERERQERLAREQAARDEAARQQALAEAILSDSAQTDLVSQYSAIIRQLISDNWNLPGNARNGMTVMLNLQLARNGEVVAATVIKSSGDAAFDRSAEQAVARVRSFPELRDMPTQIFERNFRNFNLEFRPEDLLR